MPETAGLGMERETLVDVAAAVASRDEGSIRRALQLAARFARPGQVDEILLQSHLFVGFPLALEAMIAWRSVDPATPSPAPDENEDLWATRGAEVCEAVYGLKFDRLRANIRSLHPDFESWMVVGGYGRVIGRPGVALATRELCTVAQLAVWNAPRQLRSHLRGALNASASVEDVSAAVMIAARYLEPNRVAEVNALWERVRSASLAAGSERQRSPECSRR